MQLPLAQLLPAVVLLVITSTGQDRTIQVRYDVFSQWRYLSQTLTAQSLTPGLLAAWFSDSCGSNPLASATISMTLQRTFAALPRQARYNVGFGFRAAGFLGQRRGLAAAAAPPVAQDSTGSKGPTAMVFLNMGGPSTTDDVGDFLSRLFVRSCSPLFFSRARAI